MTRIYKTTGSFLRNTTRPLLLHYIQWPLNARRTRWIIIAALWHLAPLLVPWCCL
ncbi:hypothetical protein CPB85DRAFT_1353814 [Mucidula mucida]|nr:hypothetical protein CPB85DRAFT_1353814 [Mucidula mucida]